MADVDRWTERRDTAEGPVRPRKDEVGAETAADHLARMQALGAKPKAKPPTSLLDYHTHSQLDAKESAKVWEKAEHPFGVKFESSWQEPFDGFAEHARRCARALDSAGAPVHLRSPTISIESAMPNAERDVAAEMDDLVHKSVATYCALVHQVVPNSGLLFRIVTQPRLRRYMGKAVVDRLNGIRVLSTVWERHGGIPDDDVKALNRVAQCWVNNPRSAQVLADAGVEADKLRVVPVPYHPDDPHLQFLEPEGKKRWRPGPPRFLNIGKWEPRKEQRNIILAFLRAFEPREANLLIKTSPGAPDFSVPVRGGYEDAQAQQRTVYPPSPAHAVAEALRDELVIKNGWTLERVNQDVTIIQKYLLGSQLVKLHQMADVYVTLSRGEGFDMPSMDSKLAGNTMVYTPSGGPQSFADVHDFCVGETQQVPCDPFYGWAGATYLDYHLESASMALRLAAEHLDKRSTRAELLGRLEPVFSVRAVGEAMRKYLSELPGWPL